jgi:prepilin-type N-terminal cleavage/methylation domain-containing protein/prepilin-type processing-associated H-X9-DG protein
MRKSLLNKTIIPPGPNAASKRDGFTLIELLVVIAIIAIVASIASFVNARSIINCPTAAATPRNSSIDPDPLFGPAFHYGMNARISYPLPPETPFRVSHAAQPSAFVAFSEERAHASETPYFGNNPGDVSSSYNFTTRFSGRHASAGNIAFGDGHAASFRYDYVCVPRNGQPADPGRPDINWASSGQPIP